MLNFITELSASKMLLLRVIFFFVICLVAHLRIASVVFFVILFCF